MDDVIAHALGDYALQTQWMAEEKTHRTSPAVVHALTYTACFLPVTRNPKALLVIGGSHFAIDRWRLIRHFTWARNQVAPRRYRHPATPTGYSPNTPDWLGTWLMIVNDNLLHILINRWALRRFPSRHG